MLCSRSGKVPRQPALILLNRKALVACIALIFSVLLAGCTPAVQAPPRKPALKVSPDSSKYFNHFVISDQPHRFERKSSPEPREILEHIVR